MLSIQGSEGNDFHLAVECQFTKQVWRGIGESIGASHVWLRNSVVECFRNCNNNKDMEDYRALPTIINWSVWMTRNDVLFEGTNVLDFFCNT